MEELARQMLKNAYIDFEGKLDIEQVRELLRSDDSPEARSLLSKLLGEKTVDDLMLTVADCLRDYIRGGIDEKVIRGQLVSYSQS